MKGESEKAGLKPSIQKNKIMASSPITSWQIDGGKSGNSDRLYFLGLQNHSDCSHEIRRWLRLQKKAIINLDSVLKSRHHLANEDPYSQSYGFFSSHVRMWELDHKEGWVPKNWCFQIVVLEKTLMRVPWTERRSNQSILKGINPEYSLEELILKLKIQYFGHLTWRADSLEKTDAGKDWRQKEKRAARCWIAWIASPTPWAWAWENSRR